MARPLMSPKAMLERRQEAMKLLDKGLASYRAVADELGVHHSSVRTWWLTRAEDGSAPAVKFSRHGNPEHAWDEAAANERQAARAARVAPALDTQRTKQQRARRVANAAPSVTKGGATKQRKQRMREMGPTLRTLKGLPPASTPSVQRKQRASTKVNVTPCLDMLRSDAVRKTLARLMRYPAAEMTNRTFTQWTTAAVLSRWPAEVVAEAQAGLPDHGLVVIDVLPRLLAEWKWTQDASGVWSNPDDPRYEVDRLAALTRETDGFAALGRPTVAPSDEWPTRIDAS